MPGSDRILRSTCKRNGCNLNRLDYNHGTRRVYHHHHHQENSSQSPNQGFHMQTPIVVTKERATSKQSFSFLSKLSQYSTQKTFGAEYSSGFDSEEDSPKTDYTYARSRSYKSQVTPSRDSTNPNMSRTKLRTSYHSDSSSGDDVFRLLHNGSLGAGSSQRTSLRSCFSRGVTSSTPNLLHQGVEWFSNRMSGPPQEVDVVYVDQPFFYRFMRTTQTFIELQIVERTVSTSRFVSSSISSHPWRWLFLLLVPFLLFCYLLPWSRGEQNLTSSVTFFPLAFFKETESRESPAIVSSPTVDYSQTFLANQQSFEAQVWAKLDEKQKVWSEEMMILKLALNKSNQRQIELQNELSSYRNCCRENAFHLREDQIIQRFLQLFNRTQIRSGPWAPLSDIIISNFVSSTDLNLLLSEQMSSTEAFLQEAKLEAERIFAAAKREGGQQTAQMISENNLKLWAEWNQRLSQRSSTSQKTTRTNRTSCPSENDVQTIVQNALLLYDADKTGQFDYALETAGGSVTSTRCAETYNSGTAQFTIFGVPLWHVTNSPRSVIQPQVHPGQCWAFKGSQGYLVIQLSSIIQPSAFTMEHIPRSLSPHGRIDSAPKDFIVIGLMSEEEVEGKVLGKYAYLDSGPSLQHFLVADPEPGYFPFIELRIESNYGNQEYTCLYRFRVHGKPL